MRAAVRWLGRATGELLLLPVHVYRMLRPALGPPRCRFYPSCSTYAVHVVRHEGPIIGTARAAWRVARCNPWNRAVPGQVDAPPGWTFPVSRETTQGGV